MTRSEMAFVFGLVLWYLCLAYDAPALFAWLGGVLVLVGYFTAPRARVTLNANLPSPDSRPRSVATAERELMWWSEGGRGGGDGS